jgi:hypothetical protein
LASWRSCTAFARFIFSVAPWWCVEFAMYNADDLGKGRQRKKNPKNDVPTYLPFFDIFLIFSGLVLENIVMVFLGSSCRETAKNAIKKN